MSEKTKTAEELRAENEALRRQISGEKPVPACLTDEVAKRKQAGLPHNAAIEAAQQQAACDERAAADAARRECSAREALKLLQVQARSLLDSIENAIKTSA